MIQQSPDVTRLIGRLEKLDLVRRGSSDQDGRLSVTTITDKGLALLAAMDEPVALIHRTMAERISERDAKTITRLCERLHGT
jgi:DNA-binding MarR family transcriptional regulator